jgi:hypothetical protein
MANASSPGCVSMTPVRSAELEFISHGLAEICLRIWLLHHLQRLDVEAQVGVGHLSTGEIRVEMDLLGRDH